MRTCRTLTLLKQHKRKLTTLYSGDDVNTVILSGVENCAGVISGCLPTLLPIWQFLRHGRSLKSKQQSTKNSTSKPFIENKISTLKASFWPDNHPREVELGNNTKPGGSFKRLGESGNESYSVKSAEPSFLNKSVPGEEANTILITTDLQQTDMAAPREDEQSDNSLGW